MPREPFPSARQASCAGLKRQFYPAHVRHLVMTHYDQDYTDDQVDECWQHCRRLLDQDQGGGPGIELIAAREGLTLKI